MYARYFFSFFPIVGFLFLSTAKAGYITIVDGEIDKSDGNSSLTKREIEVHFEENPPLQNSSPSKKNKKRLLENKENECGSISYKEIDEVNLENKIDMLFKKFKEKKSIITISFFNVDNEKKLRALEDALWEIVEVLSFDTSIKVQGTLQREAEGIIEEVKEEIKEKSTSSIQNKSEYMRKKQKK